MRWQKIAAAMSVLLLACIAVPLATGAAGWRVLVFALLAFLPTALSFFIAMRCVKEANASVDTRVEARTRNLMAEQLAAEAANRAKTRCMAALSREIRAPMNVVLGFTRLLRRTPLMPLQRAYLDKVQSSAADLLRSVDDLLDVSRIEGGKIELVQADFVLDELLDRVAQTVADPAREKGLELVVERGVAVPAMARGDALRLEQVLVCLVDNAVRFTAVGEVAIGMDLVHDDAASMALRFTVRDTGIGMAADRHARLFDSVGAAELPAVRRLGGGRLGLTLSRHLVERMGGRIVARSGPGVGSTFWFTVPLQRVLREPQTARLHPGFLIGMRAIVVDDNKTAMHAMAQVLRSFGMVVTALDDGAAAVEETSRARRAGEPYKVVLVDWQMPGVNGFSVIEELRRADPASAAVFVMATAHEQAFLDADLDRRQLDALVVKPATASALFDALVGALGPGASIARQTRAMPGMLRIRAGTRVLIVDDNPIQQIVAREAMRDLGVVAEIASSGARALERLRGAERFDAVFMDVRMPGMDGLETTRAIRAVPACRTLPIIALTAHALEDDRALCIDAGMDDHLCKPAGPEAILACLARWVPSERRSADGVVPMPQQTAFRRLEELALHIPGFSAATVVQRLGGNAENVAALLAIFVETSDDVSRRLRTQLRLGDKRAALHTLHSLRGAASVIALDAIADACMRLESALREPAGDDVLTEHCDRLCCLLDGVITRLRIWGSRART